ncbi:MAG TPA: hypothetical protein VGS27_02100 [Candidatus Sulfotelmatobacter sp.]|nr:hypothetical protein [Candidatus Sulfotelmatobacter sp.]
MKSAETQSKAEEVFSLIETFWPDSGGGAHLSKNVADAVFGCRVVATIFYDAMKEAGIPLQHGACVLVCATETDKLINISFLACETPDTEDSKTARLLLHKKLEPLGIALMLGDAEKKKLLMLARGFENTEGTEKLLSTVIEKWRTDAKAGRMGRASIN